MYVLFQIRQSNSIQVEHLQCSNLTHFKAVIDVMQKVKQISSICKVFTLPNGNLTVEIVCDNGLTWIKVIARNLNGLNRIGTGDANVVTARSVIDQAEEYLECAKLHPFLFQTPKVDSILLNCVL